MLDDIGCNIVRWWAGTCTPNRNSMIFATATVLWYGRILLWHAEHIPWDDEFAEKMKKRG